ncbi:MAG: DUF2974 domain-containing protein [Bacilli bacterium]|nr:DUF2974 domain-containing protein [Bacilli bacterium]
MNLLNYIESFGNETFEERPFNNVDAVILSQLSYLNFDIYGKREDTSYIYLKDIPHEMFEPLSVGEFTKRKNIKLLTLLKSSLRFRNIGVGFIRNNLSVKEEEQFFAITSVLPNGDFYIAFRGTDLNMVGWKEDVNMAFIDVVPSQLSAHFYVNHVCSKLKGNFYIGGHSKGGNLAFYSYINLNDRLHKRCLHAYSFDGPGFFDAQKDILLKYKDAYDKMTKLVPQNSIVGIMLSTLKNCDIVYSTYVGIFQHDPYSWQINMDRKDFVYRKKRKRESIILERALYTWIHSIDKEDKVFAANAIFVMMGGLDLTLKDFIKKPALRIKNFHEVQKNATKEEKEKFISIFKSLIYHYRRARLYYLKRRNINEKARLQYKEN